MMTDGTVLLDAFQPEDADAHLAGEDEELARRFGWFPRRSTLQGVRDAIARWRDQWATSGPTRAFAVRLAASGDLVGGCELRLQGDRTASLSYWTFPSQRRCGLATRAVLLATDYAFVNLELTEIELQIEPDNAASRGVARRAGFTEVGAVQASPGSDAEPRTMLRYVLQHRRSEGAAAG
jgi:RimJ/RimL family protein N-acetyltransferase